MPRRSRPKPLWQSLLAVVALAAFVAGLAGAAIPQAQAAPERHTEFHTFQATPTLVRSYYLHVTGTTPRPLLVFLHGWRLTPEQAEQQTGFEEYADSHGFDVAFPQSQDNLSSWNAGGCCGTEMLDDVSFITDVVADVRAQTAVTVAYVAGFSNGGMMALRMACQTSVFAAAASVAGPLLVPCHKKVRALHIQGDEDTSVPLHGGYSGLTGTVFPDSTREGEITLEVFHGNHEWPAGATARIWSFLTSSGSVGSGTVGSGTVGPGTATAGSAAG